VAVGGSRGAVIHVGLVIIAGLSAGFVVRELKTRVSSLILPVSLATASILLYPVVFPESSELLQGRIAEAHAAESRASRFGIFGRAFSETYSFVYYMIDAPIIGYGLGLGGNGRTFVGSELDGVPHAESDWTRQIVDLGPVVGFLFIAFRVWFTLWLLKQVLRATRLTSNPLPLTLFGYVGILLFFGQLTGHGSVNGYTWLFLGVCLASCSAVLAARPAPRTHPVALASAPRGAPTSARPGRSGPSPHKRL
jgi:hypothetical protein